jgi:hypothetical protein
MSEMSTNQQANQRTNTVFLAGPTAKIMPDHTLPFWGNQDLFTYKGPICLCFFYHA